MALRLIIEDDEGATTIVPLGSEAVTIGRQDGNTIQLTEKNVSRRHARLWFENGTWVIEDLDSYNGIKVNGEVIVHRVTLREGDVIQIGDYHLALAEDTQRVAVRTESAANAQDEPILASSSAHLPVVAPEEPAGPPSASVAGEVAAPAQPAPESAARPQTTDAFEPAPAKKGSPLVIGGALLLLVGVGGFAVWKLGASGAGGSDGANQQVATAPPPPAPVGAAKAAGPAPQDAAPPPPAPLPSVQEEAKVDPPPPIEAPTEQAAGAVEAPDDHATDPSPAPKRRRNTRRTKSRAEPPPPPPPPPPKQEPPKDPADLLRQARMAQMQGNAAKAYRLASEANRIRPSKDALRVMGAAACKMGDAGKARSVYRKLSGTAKADMAKLCASRGITL